MSFRLNARTAGAAFAGVLAVGVCSCILPTGVGSVSLTPCRLQLRDGLSTPEAAVIEARGDGLFRSWYGLRVENPTDRAKRVDLSLPAGFSPAGATLTVPSRGGEDVWFSYDLPADAPEFAFHLRSRDADGMSGRAELTSLPCRLRRNAEFKLGRWRTNLRRTEFVLQPQEEDGRIWPSDLSGTVRVTGDYSPRITFDIEIVDQDCRVGDGV